MERIVRSKTTGEIFIVNALSQKVGGPYANPAIARQIRNRRAKKAAMESLGLTKVRGNLGNIYWE
jgi:hypothetical protein